MQFALEACILPIAVIAIIVAFFFVFNGSGDGLGKGRYDVRPLPQLRSGSGGIFDDNNHEVRSACGIPVVDAVGVAGCTVTTRRNQRPLRCQVAVLSCVLLWWRCIRACVNGVYACVCACMRVNTYVHFTVCQSGKLLVAPAGDALVDAVVAHIKRSSPDLRIRVLASEAAVEPYFYKHIDRCASIPVPSALPRSQPGSNHGCIAVFASVHIGCWCLLCTMARVPMGVHVS
jgi:hypothetical protein